MSAVTVENYSPEVFKVIPDFVDAVSMFATKHAADAVDVLGPIFVKHNMYRDYGLIMIHQHFPIGKDEILVETINLSESVSVTMPWTVKGCTASPTDMKYWNSFNFTMDKYILPHSWTYSETGALQPFEFWSTNQVDNQPNDDFLAELYSALKKLGLEKVFGLRRVRHSGSAYETTPEGIRANIVKFGEIPAGMDRSHFVKVVFLIDENGRGRVGLWCGNCCNHCNHCHHCGSHPRS